MNLSQRLPVFFSYFIVVIPLVLISGPFLPDLIVVSLGLYYFFICTKEKQFDDFKNIYFKLFLIFCLYLLLVSLSSLNFYSIKTSIFYVRFGFFALAVSYLILKNPKILNYLFFLFLLIYFILFFDSIFQYFFSKNIFGFQYINENNFRITSFFGDDEVLGSYTARFFPIVLFFILLNDDSKFSKKNVILISLITIIAFIIVLISGERTALGLYILSFFFIFFSSKKFRKIFIIPLVGIIFVFVLTISSSERIKYRVLTSTINQMGLNDKSNRIVIFSKTYEGHYLISLKMFKEKKLFGHGPKMFRFYCSKDENYVAPNACTTHPHNFYAQMLAELGIIGFIILLYIFMYISYLFLKNLYFQVYKKKQYICDVTICLLGYYFMTLFPLLPSGNFFNNWLSIIMYFPLGFLIYVIKKKKFYV